MSQIYTTIDGTDYKIWSDQHCWHFGEYLGEDDDGNDRIQNRKHYSKIEDLFKGLTRHNLRTSDYTSFQEIKENLESIETQVKSILNNEVPEGANVK